MPDTIPNHVPSPRTLLAWDGTAYRPVTIDAAGHVQIDVLTSGLPAGAATAANQATEITALQLIDNLVNALQSVATDRLQVRGEDQLFSYGAALVQRNTANLGPGEIHLSAPGPAAGLVWNVTNICAVDDTTATTAHLYVVYRGVTNYLFAEVVQAFGIGDFSFYHGELWLDPGDYIAVFFTGSAVGDTCSIHITGHIMTLEV